jgi:hypothetical protein
LFNRCLSCRGDKALFVTTFALGYGDSKLELGFVESCIGL